MIFLFICLFCFFFQEKQNIYKLKPKQKAFVDDATPQSEFDLGSLQITNILETCKAYCETQDAELHKLSQQQRGLLAKSLRRTHMIKCFEHNVVAFISNMQTVFLLSSEESDDMTLLGTNYSEIHTIV